MQKQKYDPYPRPFSVTLLAFGVLSIALIFLFRTIFSFIQWTFLDNLSINISPFYMIFTGLGWSATGLILSYRIWTGRKGTRKFSNTFTIFFLIYFWIEQLFIMTNPNRSTNWLFILLLCTLFLIFSISAINRKASKQYFGDMNE
ncbi:MAG: hypothetical protein HON98_12840 [Chloroflexi bacterium]|jgi:hypothetical protein|nr:hypothetical protein [Chloroflexota bacterium]MBT4533673.1 hypothetical protein [Chloroflexota bacterium]MBT4681684.1 hypothetical protein [Chloroflexota bacterium]MBT4756563.1 hypothetical protein [Chloroflexota bacterium]MBT6151568.1 hypothetical protein [Chloroflexota bacterium]